MLLGSQLRAKITDFGNSRILDLDLEASPETLTTLPGTLEYMPYPRKLVTRLQEMVTSGEWKAHFLSCNPCLSHPLPLSSSLTSPSLPHSLCLLHSRRYTPTQSDRHLLIHVRLLMSVSFEHQNRNKTHMQNIVLFISSRGPFWQLFETH